MEIYKMPRFTGQNKKKINPRYFLNETSMEPWERDGTITKPGKHPYGMDGIRHGAKSLALSDPSIPGNEGESASLELRGATMEQVLETLADLVSSGEITPEQLEVAADRMREVESQYGMYKEEMEHYGKANESNFVPWDESRYSTWQQMADIEEEIREFSKDTTGSRDTYGSAEELAKYRTPEEMMQYFKSLTSPKSDSTWTQPVVRGQGYSPEKASDAGPR